MARRVRREGGEAGKGGEDRSVAEPRSRLFRSEAAPGEAPTPPAQAHKPLAEPHYEELAADAAAIAAATPAPPPHPERGFSGPLGLSDRQRAAVRTAVTTLSILVVVAAIGGLVWLVGLFVETFSSVFLPLVVAAVLALVLSPFYELLHHRLRLPAPIALSVVFVALVAPFVGFFWFFGALAAEQLGDLFHRLPEWWSKAVAVAQERWPSVAHFLETNPLGQKLREAAEGQAHAVAAGLGAVGAKALSAGAVLLHFFGALIHWAVLPVYFVFFLMADRQTFANWERHVFPFLKPETRKDVVYLGSELIRLVVTFFRGQLLIAFIQGVLYAGIFTVIGLRYGFILGLTLGMLNLVPYLGTTLGLGITLPLALFQDGGGWWMVGAILVSYLVVHSIESYFLTPRIMGDRTGLHPMAVIVAIFFWGTALDGILGMILAIPLTAFLVVVWHLARDKYIREWI